MEESMQKKSGFVTLIGRPNVGKSTLMNHLIEQKTAIISDKPQTTRNKIQTVYTDDRDQIIFLDIPGIHKAKNKLGQHVVNAAEHTLKEVDAILWLVEPATSVGADECHVAEQLRNVKTLIILVVNKIDMVKNRNEILTFIAARKGVCDFAETAPLFTLKDKNTDLLTELTFKHLPYGPQFYDEDMVMDQLMRQIAVEFIREEALHLLDGEIPHGTAVTAEKMKGRKGGLIDTGASTVREGEPRKGTIIGKGGSMLRRIGIEAGKEIENVMDTQANLQLWVKARKEWRDSELYVKNYGYNQKEI